MSTGGEEQIKLRFKGVKVVNEEQNQSQPVSNGKVAREGHFNSRILHPIESRSACVRGLGKVQFHTLHSWFFLPLWYCGEGIGRRSRDWIVYGVKGRHR